MKLIFILLFVCQYAFGQKFGKVKVNIQQSPEFQHQMEYYKWYNHHQENNIYIISFETSLAGFHRAFSELEYMLDKNNIDFNSFHSDESKFHYEIKSGGSFEALHNSIVNDQSRVFRTWNSQTDYLSLLLEDDVYMLILGSNNKE